ncbi:hypothetical protein J6590_092713 [Homalodisca vitripennis]|nr:hypothetical protein J6590_093596 [Homalodisca vitripennis]KAG8270096.1 hypothetical protein J6590_092713 [Homalodisca vitripennis]
MCIPHPTEIHKPFSMLVKAMSPHVAASPIPVALASCGTLYHRLLASCGNTSAREMCYGKVNITLDTFYGNTSAREMCYGKVNITLDTLSERLRWDAISSEMCYGKVNITLDTLSERLRWDAMEMCYGKVNITLDTLSERLRWDAMEMCYGKVNITLDTLSERLRWDAMSSFIHAWDRKATHNSKIAWSVLIYEVNRVSIEVTNSRLVRQAKYAFAFSRTKPLPPALLSMNQYRFIDDLVFI